MNQLQKATQPRQYSDVYRRCIVENYKECGIPATMPSAHVNPRRRAADRVYAKYGHAVQKGARS